MSKSKIFWVAGIGIFVFIVIFGFILLSNGANKTKPKTNRELLMSCTSDAATQYHIHPHLQIVINGQAHEVPANIGIENNCLHPIHTHDNSGIIHIESPEKRDFTLGDFFTVWGKTFNKDQILDYKREGNHTIKVTVDGQDSQDFEKFILKDNQQIVITAN